MCVGGGGGAVEKLVLKESKTRKERKHLMYVIYTVSITDTLNLTYQGHSSLKQVKMCSLTVIMTDNYLKNYLNRITFQIYISCAPINV